MKRIIILVVALVSIITGLLMDGSPARAENHVGDYYIKGKVVALEGCERNGCIAVVKVNDQSRVIHIVGDVQIGASVYRECTSGYCKENWQTSIGETYLHGGEAEL